MVEASKNVKKHIRENFPYKSSLAAEQPLEEIKNGKLFDCVQCVIEVPENLTTNFDNFLPIFKNTLIRKKE